MTGSMRFWFSTLTAAPFFLSALLGCAAPAQSGGGPRVAAALPSAASAAAPAPSAAAPAAAASGTPSGVQPLPRLPEIVLDPKQPLRSLPELKVENIGLHIGGGPNDADTKAPFLRAIAERFPAFMDCYRKNEDPAKGGRFGIDLHIARAGGHPRTEQPRTAMHGPDFRSCVSSVFESVEFQKPTHGPTTVSYSLHFTVGEAP
jgi:hypothetical protein